MNQFAEFTQNMSKLESEAWDWIIRLDADQPLSRQEKAMLTEWLSRSPAHIDQIRKLNEFWANTLLTELIVPAKVRAENKRAENIKHQKARSLNQALGFAFAVIFSVFGLMFWTGGDFTAQDLNTSYVTAIGQQQKLTLADGSKVVLNSDSQLKISYTEESRDIWLVKGEAHFDVQKDKSRPFNVYAANGRVQAVGTSFSVDVVRSSDINVLVTEGRIALAVASIEDMQSGLNEIFSEEAVHENKNQHNLMQEIAFMDAGEFIALDSSVNAEKAKQLVNTNIRKLSSTEIEAKQAWQQGELVFTGETLKEVVQKLKRYSPLEIEITDPSIENLKIGGRFTVNHIEMLFKNLEANFNVEVQKTALNKVKISQGETQI